MPQLSPLPGKSPGLFRRLAAFSYDALAILAIWFFATLLIVIVQKGAAVESGNPLYVLYLLGCAYLYAGISWTHGGQTLGMKSWKFALRSAQDDETSVSWRTATIRFAVAGASIVCLGLGYLWVLFNHERRSWHDIASATYLCNVAD